MSNSPMSSENLLAISKNCREIAEEQAVIIQKTEQLLAQMQFVWAGDQIARYSEIIAQNEKNAQQTVQLLTALADGLQEACNLENDSLTIPDNIY